MEIAQGFLGQLAQLRSMRGAFTQDRHQLAGTLAQTLANQVLVEHFYCSPLFTPSAGARVQRGGYSTSGARLHRGIQTMHSAADIPQTDHVGWRTAKSQSRIKRS